LRRKPAAKNASDGTSALGPAPLLYAGGVCRNSRHFLHLAEDCPQLWVGFGWAVEHGILLHGVDRPRSFFDDALGKRAGRANPL
jgi:hypothetical protein